MVGDRVRDGTHGTFVTIEGLDFSGKSTLVGELKRLMGDERVHFTREPGGTPAAERIREVVLDPAVGMDDWTEAYLYAAARVDHARRGILPRLRRGEDVVCERYLDSSLAYQGAGRGLGLEAVRTLNARAVEAATPDRTFYLKLDARERERRAGSRGDLDRLERAGSEFMERVEAAFEELARLESERIEVLDATRPPAELAGIVRRFIEEHRYTSSDGFV